MEIALRDILYVLMLAIGVAGSHFVLRAKVMVLEERSRNHGHQFDQIMTAIERLEKKLERKADR